MLFVGVAQFFLATRVDKSSSLSWRLPGGWLSPFQSVAPSIGQFTRAALVSVSGVPECAPVCSLSSALGVDQVCTAVRRFSPPSLPELPGPPFP